MSEQRDGQIVSRAAHLLQQGRRFCHKGNVLNAASHAGQIRILAEQTENDTFGRRLRSASARLFNLSMDKLYGKVE